MKILRMFAAPPCPRRAGLHCVRAAARALCVFALVALLERSLGAIVVSEIMYHPREANDAAFEYFELYNESQDPFDLSGYFVCNGVALEFPPDTWLDGKSFLVVCGNLASFRAKYGSSVAAIQWTSGTLDNGGERLEICNGAGRTVIDIRYNDRDAWASGADGTGHSLEMRSPFLDGGDAESWRLSRDLDGSPGEPNGPGFETGGITPPANGMDGAGFIVTWLTLGPYTGSQCGLGDAALQADWLREATGGIVQTDLVWREDDVVNTSYAVAQSTGLHPNGGAVPRVRAYDGASDTINFNDAVYPPDPNQVMAYAFVYVDNVTSSAIPVDIAVHSDDAIAVLVNGVHRLLSDACRGVGGAGEVADRASATLAVGKNLIAVKVFEDGGGWAFRLRLEDAGTGQPITSKARIQITTDVDAGLFFGGGGTPIEPPDEEPPPPPPPGEEPGASPVLINEGLLFTAGARWIEIYNRSTSLYDLAGHHITDDPAALTKTTLPSTIVPAGGFVSFTDAQLGLDLDVPVAGTRVFVALVEPGGDRVLDAYNFQPDHFEMSEARLPDGDDDFSDASDPTRGTANVSSANRDIVINEIMYHPIDDDLGKEYIELYNRGTSTVSLNGWSFTEGVNFAFSAGTSLAPGAYLLVARDPAKLRAIYGLPSSMVVGPAQTAEALDAFGRLANGGERLRLQDALGRTVDTVRYHDGGEWAEWADGLGSSLELIDARQDNVFGQAWDASDDAAKAVTQHFSYLGRHGGGESELSLLLLDNGICLVDDISIIGGGVTTDDTPLIDAGETWRYFKGTVAPPATWANLGFNDGSWLQGPTGIGYGDGDDATILDDMQNSYVTVYCRKTFNVANPAAIDELVLSITIDDGFYAYLNGTQVASFNVAGTGFQDSAPTAIGNGDLVERDITEFRNLLQPGTNVLALQVHNAGIGSSDLTIIPRLLDRTTMVGNGTELVGNGTFDSNVAGWIIQGTHVRTGRTTQNTISGAGSLKMLVSGRGDNKANRIETPNGSTGLANFNTNEDLAISFNARWVVGSPTIVSHGFEHAMARTHRFDVPEDLGTPGARNSVTQRLIDRTGGSNLGPVIRGFRQDPAVPAANESVRVSVRVHDPDGVASVTLRYSLNDPSASPLSVNMAAVGGGRYEATIPGRPLGTKVVFWITATDAQGRTGRYPVDITERSHPLVLQPPAASIHDHRYLLYRHDVADPGTPYHSYRFVMTDTNEAELTNRARLSNDPVPGAFVFGAEAIYQESFTRFSGSPFARGSWGGSFRVELPQDDLLHGTIPRFNLDNRHGNGTDARERISHYLLRQHNRGGTVVPYSEPFMMARWQVNARNIGTREHVVNPNGDFNEFWFPLEEGGEFFEVDDRFVIGDDGGSNNGSTNARVLYPPPSSRSDGDGENKENYRWFFNHRGPRTGQDDYAPLIEFARIMDPGVTPDALFDQQIWDLCDVEEFLRIWSVRLNTDDWDQWGANRGKNCYLFRPDADARFRLYAWDMELTYGSTTSFLIPTNPSSTYNAGGFSEVNRMFNRPRIKRMWYAILDEMVNGPDAWFDSAFLSTYMTKLAAIGLARTEIGQPGGFIDQRADLLRDRIQSVVYPQVRMEITTNSGNAFTTSQATVDLAGRAPTEIHTIAVDGDLYQPAFTSMTNWSVERIRLQPGVNDLTLLGLDLRGMLVDSDTIRVTSTAEPLDPPAITSLSPSSAPAGDLIDIIGTDFHDGVRVFFGSVEASRVIFDEDGPDPDTISVEVPSGSGSVNVTVMNFDGQTSNSVTFLYTAPPPRFLRGDGNGDSFLDISDAVRGLFYLYADRPSDCLDALDVNDDETIDLTDPVYLLNYLFELGPAPAAPFPAIGADPSGDALDCTR